MLKVRYGPFQPELERAFLDELRLLRREDPLAPLAVVTPSRRLADRLQRLAALEAGESLLFVRFHTFYSLALETVREKGLDRTVVADPMFFDRLLDSLLGTGRRPRGLAAAVRSSLKDLIDAGVEARALELVDEGLVGELHRDGLEWLLGLLGRYEARLKDLKVMPVSGLIQRATEAALACPAAVSGEAADGLERYRAFLYYGFYDLTGLQADFFAAVARARPVTAFIPFRRRHPAFLFAQRFFDTKLRLGGEPPLELGTGGEGALRGALDALFEPGKRGTVEKGRLRVFTASGERDEAWRVAKEILRLAEEGVAYSDIGVVARILDPYAEAIAAAFRESKVPFHISAWEPLLRRPSARACLTLLTLARREFPALAVLDLVESPFFKGPGSRGWRALVRRLRIRRGWLQWEGKLRAAPDEDSRALWECLTAWREGLSPSGRRSWAEWAAYAREFLLASLAADDPAFAQALKTLDGLSTLDLLGESADWTEFLEAAEAALARAKLESPEANKGVRVLDAMEARGESFRVLFLVGLTEGLFPRAIREDPLLRDSARSALRETAGYWIAPKQAGHEEEKLLFYLMAAAASDRLYCSYPRSDEEGKARIPSVYLLELLRAAGLSPSDPELVERVPRQPLERLMSPRLVGLLSPRELSVACALSGVESPRLDRLLGRGPSHRELLRRVEELGRPGEPGPHDGVIGSPDEHLRRLRLKGLSPSGLESFVRCPFQYFASRVLGLEEREEPFGSAELPPAVKGEMYHQFLAGFYGRLIAAGYFQDASEGRGFPEGPFQAAEEDLFQRFGWRELGLYPLLWEILREGMRENLRRLVEWDLGELAASGLKPVLLEAAMRSELELRLPPALEGLEFQGRLDRVDAGGGTFRVVDYKTTVRRESLGKLALAGKSLQPPLYLELAARHGDLRELTPRGVLFLGLEGFDEALGRPPVGEYAPDTHREGRAALFESLSRHVEAAAQGRFPIRPDESEFGHCRRCSFSGICRKGHPMTAARAAGEPS